MKPPFTMDYDDKGDCLYITGSDNRPASAIEFPGGIVRFADDDGSLVGVTLIGVTKFKNPE